MRQTRISLPELGLVAGTRFAFGLGLGLLIRDHLPPEVRRAVGWTLVTVGAITTAPLALDVLGRSEPEHERVLAEV